MCVIKSRHLPSDFLLAIYHWGQVGQVCHATPFPESARTVESAAQKKASAGPLKGVFSWHSTTSLLPTLPMEDREIFKKWSETRSPKNAQDVRAEKKRIQNSDRSIQNLQNGRPKLAKTLLMFGSGKICCVVQVVIWCYLLGTDFVHHTSI